jgi:hypothetical protein
MEEHPQEFDHPGKCPICGMELVEKHGASWHKLESRGDTDRWRVRGTLEVSMDSEEFLDLSAKQIVAKGWKLQARAKGQRAFVKDDGAGQRWRTTFSSASTAGSHGYMETMTVEKVAR